jgi:Integrase core domain
VLTLGYSRRTFVRAFLADRQEHWLAAMEAAFRHFGGVPREMLVDNARALVTFHPHSGEVQFSDAFVAFCQLHEIAPRACRPFRARSKGKVESGVKYVKRNALAGMSFTSFEALEAHLERWMREVADVRVHGTTHERPIDRFAAEATALLPLRVVTPIRCRSRARSRAAASSTSTPIATRCPTSTPGARSKCSLPRARSRSAMTASRSRGTLRPGRHKVVARPEHYQGLWPRREPASPTVESLIRSSRATKRSRDDHAPQRPPLALVTRLRLVRVRELLDSFLEDAAKRELSYADVLDGLLSARGSLSRTSASAWVARWRASPSSARSRNSTSPSSPRSTRES